MNDKCPFKQRGKCDIWVDYQVSLIALEDASDLANENWEEINYLLDRVALLEKALKDAGIEIPPKY